MTFFEQTLQETGVRPAVAATDKAACYPPALERVLPEAEHVTGKMVQQRIERGHGHLKSRIRSMRWFKTDQAASLFCRAHGFIHNGCRVLFGTENRSSGGSRVCPRVDR